MRAMIAVKHHDHAYVEKRGGWEWYTHMRSAPSRVRTRRVAIQRAGRLFGAPGITDEERNGRGLLVLQRTLLALEDLGGLLHAFAGPPMWDRLRGASYEDIDLAFQEAATDPDPILAKAGLADRTMLSEEGLTSEQADA